MSAASYKFGGETNIKAASASTGITFSGADPKVDTTDANITLTGPVVISNGELDINSAGGNIEITGAITSAGVDESLRLDDGTGTSGTITLGSTASSGSINLIGDSGINLSGNLASTATADGEINLTGPVTLAGNITIDADAQNTDVTFSSTINATSSGGQSLTIDTAAGNVAIQGAIGGSTALSALSIDDTDGAGTIEINDIGTASAVGVTGNTAIGNTATTTLTLDGAEYKTTGTQSYRATSGDNIAIGTADTVVDFVTTDNTITFTEADLVLANGANTTIDTGSGGGNITFTTSAIHGTAGSTTTDLVLDAGTGTVSLNLIDGATTDINDITITGPTTLNGNVNTGTSGTLGITGNVSLATGAIVIDTSNGGGGTVTITGTLDGGQDLDILSGTALTSITGNIGASTPLTSLDIQQSAGAGGITLGGNIGVADTAGAGTTRLGNTNTTGTITLNGTLYHTGAATYTADAFTIGGTDPIFKTTNLGVEFAEGNVTLADAADLSVTTGNGAITFGGNILGTGGGVATDVTLNSGTQTTTVKTIGSGSNINDVSITGGTISTNGTITTAEVGGGSSTAGNVTLTGAVSLAGNTTIDTSSSGGTVGFTSTIDGAKTLTITSGAGNVDIAGIIGGTTAVGNTAINDSSCLLYTSPSPRDAS